MSPIAAIFFLSNNAQSIYQKSSYFAMAMTNTKVEDLPKGRSDSHGKRIVWIVYRFTCPTKIELGRGSCNFWNKISHYLFQSEKELQMTYLSTQYQCRDSARPQPRCTQESKAVSQAASDWPWKRDPNELIVGTSMLCTLWAMVTSSKANEPLWDLQGSSNSHRHWLCSRTP